MSVSLTLRQIADAVGGELHGDPEYMISGIATLRGATPSDLSFLTKATYQEDAIRSEAGCILVSMNEKIPSRDVIRCPDIRESYVAALSLFDEAVAYESHVSSSAAIGDNVLLGDDIYVGEHVSIGKKSVIGAGTILHDGCRVGRGCLIGDRCIIHRGAVIEDRTTLGNRVIVWSNAVIGASGFGFIIDQRPARKVPQLGSVLLEDDVEIGACSCVDRATLGATRIGARTKIDNLVQIGHNVSIGEDCVIIGQAGVAGSVKIENSVTLMGQVGVRGHVSIGSHATVLAKSAVAASVPPGEVVGGIPAINHREWKRIIIAVRELPKIIRRLK